jgi:hypothetical protein
VIRVDGDGPADPDRVDGQVSRDGQQPGYDAAPTGVEDRGVTPGSKQRFLGDVLSGVAVTQDGEGKPEDPPLKPRHEGRGGFSI